MSPGTAAKRAEYKHLSALLFCWDRDSAERRQSAISCFLRGSGDLAECRFAVTCGEGFIRRRVKPPVTVCGCRPMQMCCRHGVFWQVRFSLARGLGETAVRYTGPTRGRGCKRVPRAEWYCRNTWRCSHTEGLSGGIWWKTFNFGEVNSDSQQRSLCDVQHRTEEMEQTTDFIVFVLFCFKISAQVIYTDFYHMFFVSFYQINTKKRS